ncbi:MAG: polysulfide reductase NrfD [Chloroflexi bacterium]|nr:polysulfide reductase NrfD [Chloroflexota bacterium]
MTTATLTPRAQQPLRQPPFLIWLGFLGILLVWGLISGIMVFGQGLGVTGLTDQVPWGLWIALDLSAISLGAGAFIFSAIVYLLKIERFQVFARAAVLVGFLGYTSAMLALALDIGRPDRFYFPVIYPNVHSVLWEITMCVIFYFAVLAAELAPVVLGSQFFSRWPQAKQIGHTIHRFTPILAVFGLGLSLLHQSSLGATYGVVAARPLWFKPSLPVMFILSAVAGGTAATILGSLIVSRLRGKYVVDRKVISQAAIIGGSSLALYLYIKIWDWATTQYYAGTAAVEEGISLLQATTPYGFTYWTFEVLLGGLIPLIIFFWARSRKDDFALMLGCLLTIVGVVFLRWNVTVSGLIVPLDWSPGEAFLFARNFYAPTLPELGAFFGIIAYALAGFTLAVTFLPIYEEDHSDHHDDADHAPVEVVRPPAEPATG